jgi:hypothetical protein
MIIEWSAYPDNGAIGYGLNTILDWTSSIPADAGEWTTPTSVHSKCGEAAPNYAATKAKDDNTSTYWSHISTCYHWIIFDFSQTYTITKIRIYQGILGTLRWGTTDGLDVYVSDNPADWGSAVWTGTLLNQGWQESGAFSKNGRYLKLVSKNNLNTQRMYEFDAYCAAAGGGSVPVFMHSYRNLREA